MNVLEIILDNRLGGISVRALAAAGGMAERGVKTHFLLPKGPGDVHDSASDCGVTVHRAFMPLPNPRKPVRSLMWLLTIPVNTLQIRRIVRKHGIDAIHVNGLLNLSGFFAAKWCSVPLIWHLAGTATYPRWLVHLFRPLLKRATVLVCIAVAVRNYFLGDNYNAYSYRIIHEPVSIEAIQTSSRQAIRKSLGISDQACLVVAVGNVSPVKGILYGIRAIAELAKSHDNIHYLVVGARLDSQKEHTAMLEREIAKHNLQDKVTFAGKRADVYDILCAADIFLLSSLSEGTPISILEAMTAKVPVVAANVGGVSEQIVHEESGLLVPPRDSRAMAAAIARLLEDPVFADLCVTRAHATVEAEFSLANFLDEFEQLLADYVGC